MASSEGNGNDARFVIRLRESPVCAKPLRRRQVLNSYLYPLTLNDTGYLILTVTY